MKILRRNGLKACGTIAAVCLIVLLLPVWQPAAFGGSEKPSPSPEEKLRLGERMYREGILPSGEPMEAIVKGDLRVPGTSFTCVSCHLRSGLGSVEGGVITPPTNGVSLYKPFRSEPIPTYDINPFTPPQIVAQNLKYFQAPPPRPVYTDASLETVLQDGVDSAGRTISDIMPRYPLAEEDMAILIAYLKSLSSEFSPGVTDTTIRFATIIAEDVRPEDRNAMLIPLENFIRNKNLTNYVDPRERMISRSTGFRSRVMAEVTLASRGAGIRKLSLSRWVLKGSPDTWRSQLEEYNRKEPVFAILGGIAYGDWQPIHQFCEENHIPDIFPMTDFPVISQTDWYTLYLSKGYYQEGEGAARFLNGKDEVKGKPIVQFVRDTRVGRALSRGFQETWAEYEQKAPVTVTLKAGEPLTAEVLQRELARVNPAAIILWDGPESLKTLEMLAAGKNRPAMVLVSSGYLGKSMLSLEEQVRGFTYITYPYGMSQTAEDNVVFSMGLRNYNQEPNTVAPPMGVRNFNVEANTVATIRISQKTYILTLIMDMALIDLKGNYYRDNLLDVTGMFMDLYVPLYERISFGPNQRYTSKGCYVVQLGKSGLVKKSDWMTN